MTHQPSGEGERVTRGSGEGEARVCHVEFPCPAPRGPSQAGAAKPFGRTKAVAGREGQWVDGEAVKCTGVPLAKAACKSDHQPCPSSLQRGMHSL